MTTEEILAGLRKVLEPDAAGYVHSLDDDEAEAVQAAITALEQRAGEERDAARYRWLRSRSHWQFFRSNLWEEDLDAFIDETMTKQRAALASHLKK